MAPAWLTAQPIAHRGWHDASAGRIENSPSAARAAIARGFAIECDVQLSSDGEVLVFHDTTLERLTFASGPVASHSLAELQDLTLKGTCDKIPSFEEYLVLIAGAAPLICELKSRFDGDLRLADRAAEIAESYAGPLAFKSFDPAPIGRLRAKGISRPLGIVAQASYDDLYFSKMSGEQKRDCAAFLHIEATRPDFLSWFVDDLPHPTPTLLRALAKIPVMTWTVRTAAQKRLARAYADQIVFEGEAE
jgi:glycerophosphoryl diester phosphodiesterase